MRAGRCIPVASPALLAAAAALAACTLALACPAQAVAYEYWYKVYDADMSLLYSSEDPASAATSVDVNTLGEGIWFECYYNGREDPLPSVACMSSYCYVADASTGEVISTRNSSVAAFEGDDGSGIDYTRSDCLTTDELGNTKFQFDEDGYFCGILYTLKFYEVDAVTAGTQVEFSMYLVPYLSSVGGRKDESTCVAFTLDVTASSDEGDAGEQEGDEAESAGTTGQAIGSATAGEGSSGGSDGSGSQAASGAASSSSSASAEGASSADGADASSAASGASASARSVQGAEEQAAGAREAGSSAASTGTAARQNASATQTLGSLGTVLAVSGTGTQDDGAVPEALAITGLPWLQVLLVAVLAAAVLLGGLACVLQHRRRAQAASRLVGA